MMRTSSRFQPFTSSSLRTTGLRRLKTALSPSPASSVSSARSFASSTPRSSPSTTYTSASTSPASSDCGCDHHTSHNGLQLMGLDSALENGVVFKPVYGARARLRAMLMRRRRMASVWESQVEEEQRVFGNGVRVFEPRAKEEIVMASIFEVLDQRQ